METVEKNIKGKIEYCVVCGEKTRYTFDVPISEREHYIEGAGQLCPKCFEDIEREAENMGNGNR